ncbi:MAG: hypothetical protein MJY89_01635 [Bacteroidales bacterium]|nr:hypothetical protein [Bacteroidales bacterium]
MKKTVVIIAATILALCSCSPLRIVMNSTSPDGERTILTSDQHLFSYNKGELTAALGCRIQGRDTVLALLVTSDANSGHGIFDKGDRIMVRFNDESVMELTNIYDKEFETYTESGVTQHMRTDFGYAYYYDAWTGSIDLTPYQINRMIPEAYTRKVSNSYALYLLSKKDIVALMTKPVIKFRVEIEDADLDMPNTGEVNNLFSAMMSCLKEDGINKKFERSAF